MAGRNYIEDLIYGRKKSFLLGRVLWWVSLLYGLAVRLRNGLYTLGILRSRKLPLKLISVGNITLGGTGKTPAVIEIACLLRSHNRHPVVISRGYGRRDESEVLAVSDGSGSLKDPEAAGDEPTLIGAKLPGVPVVAGSNRFLAGMFAVEKFGLDVAILDDGFQHRQLARDLDIVLVDARDPFGSGRLFPAGILREPLSALRRAQAVLLTNADSEEKRQELLALLEKYTEARIFSSRHNPVDLMDVTTGETRSLPALKGTAVLAFAGIARPSSFFSLLRSHGAEVRSEVVYPDHYAFRKSDLASLFQKAADAGASMIVTTEKDAVKLKSMNPEGIWALRIELAIMESGPWEEMIKKYI